MDITELLRFAVSEEASDIHVSSGEPPIMRIHGSMKRLDHPALSQDDVHRMIYDIMSDKQRKDFEELNELDFSFEVGNNRFRVNAFIQRRGKSAAFRVIPTTILSLEQLGLPSILKKLCEHEKGLVLVTGPTGSGKSTTLAAMIDFINNTREGHLLTIEDPIEFVHSSKKCLVQQRELGIHTIPSPTRCAAHFVRILTIFWSVKCAIWRPSSWPSRLLRQAIWSLEHGTPPALPRLLTASLTFFLPLSNPRSAPSWQSPSRPSLLRRCARKWVEVGWPRWRSW